MNKPAVRATLTEPLLLAAVAASALSTLFMRSHWPPTLVVAYVIGCLVITSTLGRVLYQLNANSLRVAATRAAGRGLSDELARLEASLAAERERWEEERARRDAEDERRDIEDEILDEDHEFRALQMRQTGVDPGPSGQAARITATRQAESTARAARDRMDRKARIEARLAAAKATTNGQVVHA